MFFATLRGGGAAAAKINRRLLAKRELLYHEDLPLVKTAQISLGLAGTGCKAGDGKWFA